MHDHVSDNLVRLHASPKQWMQIRAQHRAIWESVRSHDAQAARRAARDHLSFVRQSMAETEKAMDRRNSAMRRLGEPASVT